VQLQRRFWHDADPDRAKDALVAAALSKAARLEKIRAEASRGRPGDIRWLLEQVERLRVAFVIYARHHDYCQGSNDPPWAHCAACTCGRDDVLCATLKSGDLK